MDSIIRLTYASITTSKPATIRQDLINILDEAQAHNSNHQIYGVLFYGSDYFFQCLEGKKADIDALYEKLNNDPRHTNLALLSYEEINAPRFKGWSMKYVMHEPSIQQFFESNQWEKFNPYTLDSDLIQPFLNILHSHDESIAGEHEEVSGKQMSKGQVIDYKYALFIIILALVILLGLYLVLDYFHAPMLGNF
ncbi:BLUF domain-containing protein [Alkanindiges sp. WGS2144]|uniref:BLUF domain-containing protein n=1 Tax=Alkanindiges sp. WGS2144 TaxID=3366808 RepID=UPI00374FFCCE